MPDTQIDLLTDNLSPHGDIFYSKLIAAYDGLDEEESAALNARLILLMANQIGALPVLDAIINKAKQYENG